MVAQPHFLLFCDTHFSDQHYEDAQAGACAGGSGGGRWHFVLEQLDGPERLEAADSELTANRERLALLSVVRGLEALEQPSHVTLVTTSRYVSRGLRYGLSTWREADYMWERFGEQRPVRNSDLWRRVDTALQFHGVKCRLIQAGQTAVATAQVPRPMSSHVAAQPTAQPTMRAATGAAPAEVASGEPWAAGTPAEQAGSPARGPFQSKTSHSTAAQRIARPLPGRRWAAATPLAHLNQTAAWWSLAAAWIRWWRGRLQAKPGLYAT